MLRLVFPAWIVIRFALNVALRGSFFPNLGLWDRGLALVVFISVYIGGRDDREHDRV